MNQVSETFLGYHRYDVTLPMWEGPLDLLLDLIRASKVNIQDIPIKEITAQYLKMINLMKKINIELSADFLVMASTLILIKSRILIAEEMGDDVQDFEAPKRELIEKLLIYEQFKKATKKLSEREDKFSHYLEAKERSRRSKSYFHEEDENRLSVSWQSVRLKDILLAYLNLTETLDTPPLFQDREYSVTDKMTLIVDQVKRFKKIKFLDLFLSKKIQKQEAIVTFWGLLELYKQEIIDARQEKAFGDIYLIPGHKINTLPVNT